MLSGKQLKDTIAGLQNEHQWRKKQFAEQWIHQFFSAKPGVHEPDINNEMINQAYVNPLVLLRAQQTARMMSSQLASIQQDSRLRKGWNNYFQLELQKRYANIITGFIFFLIGAPLGGLLKKGGLGSPVVISTSFYIGYHIVEAIGSKQAIMGMIPPIIGVWLPLFILLLIAAILISISNRDHFELSISVYSKPLKKLFSFVKKA